jgi:hypothetical protein
VIVLLCTCVRKKSLQTQQRRHSAVRIGTALIHTTQVEGRDDCFVLHVRTKGMEPAIYMRAHAEKESQRVDS